MRQHAKFAATFDGREERVLPQNRCAIARLGSLPTDGRPAFGPVVSVFCDRLFCPSGPALRRFCCLHPRQVADVLCQEGGEALDEPVLNPCDRSGHGIWHFRCPLAPGHRCRTLNRMPELPPFEEFLELHLSFQLPCPFQSRHSLVPGFWESQSGPHGLLPAANIRLANDERAAAVSFGLDAICERINAGFRRPWGISTSHCLFLRKAHATL